MLDARNGVVELAEVERNTLRGTARVNIAIELMMENASNTNGAQDTERSR